MFDINKIKQNGPSVTNRYSRQLERIKNKNHSTKNIEQAVEDAISNINKNCRSFVIYGEPQSGKTEMMIALTARLLDNSFKIIIVLLNDSVQLLQQNLERFRRAALDPAPNNFNEVLDHDIKIGNNEWIIFSKKNSKDLQKLLIKIEHIDKKIIIDDEADYATPNSKINKGEKTKINSLIERLIGTNGVYIGVTATPARLDLNNTYRNENEKWVLFPTHPLYKGKETFFPTSLIKNTLGFFLELLPDTEDTPKYLRKALLNFLINVAYLNLMVNTTQEKNYSMLIHTSGKRADHSNDYKEVVKIFNTLGQDDEKSTEYYKMIYNLAKDKYPGNEESITQYIYQHRNRRTTIIMNSDADKKNVDYTSATNPSTLFTIIIGGNIVSRGVTFDNLLSMFFTRDVKHKIQQDTYIQRARMFGTRGDYLSFFELHIPNNLYLDWHKCFIFHHLSLESIKAGNGSPVWLEDSRVSSVSQASIDKTTVSLDSGEMSFEIFDYNDSIDQIILDKSNKSNIDKLLKLAEVVGENKFPPFLIEYIKHFSPYGDQSIAIHPSLSITGHKDANHERIERARGLMGKYYLQKDKFPNAIHHIKIFFNNNNKARIFYKYEGNIRFLRNISGVQHD